MDRENAAWYTCGKKYEELTLANDFMFCKVMQDPDLCRKMLNRIMGVSLGKVVVANSQKPIDVTFDGKSIRLDVFAEDEDGNIYDIEMQCSDTHELPLRSRFYQSMIDQDLLEKGEDYQKLGNTVIIFICKFDLFKQGRGKYLFRQYEENDRNLALDDRTTKIFLNTKGHVEDPLLQNFLNYLEGILEDRDPYINELEHAVWKASRNSKWRDEYMRYSMREKYLESVFMQRGLEKGIEEGRKEGRKEGCIDLVCKALERGMSEEQIISFLDVSPEVIQAAKAKMSK